MDLGIRGRVALVAASSKGLGRASAEALAAEGTSLVLCARGGDALEATAQAIRAAHGVPVTAVVADVATAAGVAAVLDAAMRAHGGVDILVTNAGGPPAGPFQQHDDAAWDHALRTTLHSVIALVRGVLPGMQARGWGRIVNVTSIAAKQPVDGLILSNAVRAAVTGFARTLANEVATHGITVNNVMPGFTRTQRVEELATRAAAQRGIALADAYAHWEHEIPMRRLGTPEEFGAMVAFLCSTHASYTTGASIPVDGGWIRALV
jgi:3-oxoacyl-[acyl-carrier protein] reductase